MRLMPASDMKAYVKRDKTDAAMPRRFASCTRPTIGFVPIESADQQQRPAHMEVSSSSGNLNCRIAKLPAT